MLSITRQSDQGWLLKPCLFSRSAIAAFQSSSFPKRIALSMPRFSKKHAQHDESLAVAGEDPIHVLDLLGCLIAPLVGLLVRPPATLTADIPLDGFH